MSLAKAFGLPDGKEYQSFENFLEDFAMRPAKVKAKNEQKEYNGKTHDNTNIKNSKPLSSQNSNINGRKATLKNL